MKTFNIPYLILRSASAPAVAAAGELRMYYDTTLGVLMQSANGAPYAPVGTGDVIVGTGLNIQSDGTLLLSDATSDATINFSHRYRLTLDGTNILVESAGMDPNGLVDPADITLSFDDASRLFTVDTVSGQSQYCVGGRAFTLTSPQSIAWSNTAGIHWFYFDADGYVATTTSTDFDFLFTVAPLSVIYWNQTVGVSVYRGDERHSSDMSGQVHAYLHNVHGAQWKSGLGLTDFSVDQDGSLDSHAQFGCEDGYFYDEDILHQITDALPQNINTELEAPTFYRLGTEWYSRPYDRTVAIWSDGHTFTGGSGLAAYNQYSAGVWSLQEVTSGDFFLVHVLATNNIDAPIICVCGSNQYPTLNAARTAAQSELIGFSGLPFAETLPLGSVLFQTRSTYSNTVKSRVRSMGGGSEYLDFRHRNIVAVGSVPSHSALAGLTSQDHPATAIYTDVSGFDGYLLSSVTTDIQLALNTIDAQVGRDMSISYVPSAATVNLDFSGPTRISVGVLAADVEFTTSGLSPATGITVRITADGTPRNLTFPAGWKFYGAARPTSLAANTTALLALESWGSSDSDVDAGWTVST